ncbi:hypothetical protein, partial [Rhodobium orientis]|uniref:hypothetical protein n=1 Tax=Rhodobium orientis TaxID=34017 RepID=UPI001AED0EFB
MAGLLQRASGLVDGRPRAGGARMVRARAGALSGRAGARAGAGRRYATRRLLLRPGRPGQLGL